MCYWFAPPCCWILYHHRGSQGTYSRTSPPLESLASSRNTASTSSLRSSSSAVVFAPSHSISIQRKLLVLAALLLLSPSLTPCLARPGYADGNCWVLYGSTPQGRPRSRPYASLSSGRSRFFGSHSATSWYQRSSLRS